MQQRHLKLSPSMSLRYVLICDVLLVCGAERFQVIQNQPLGPQKPATTEQAPAAPNPAPPAAPAGTMPMPEAVMANGKCHTEYTRCQ